MATTSEPGRIQGGYTYDSFTGVGERVKKPTESHFLWWCAGAYQDLLKDCPSEQTKYAGLGGVLLATFVLAALSSGYAIYSVFNDPAWAVAFARYFLTTASCKRRTGVYWGRRSRNGKG